MKILFTLAFISLTYGQIGKPTAGPPWYWKPSKEPLAVYTTQNPTDVDSNRFEREIKTERNPFPDWYLEVLYRKNKTKEAAQPPPPLMVIRDDECPKDVIHDRFRGKGYFFSWADKRSENLRMNWDQAVFFCRARCLELVSIESIHEHDFLAKHIMNGRLRSIWTSGRKCDFAGCEQQKEMQPTDIYGWFWEGSHVQLPPTTDRFDSLWSHTGPMGTPQPDNQNQKTGERESCLAILNNAYGDGITWHDVACSKRKPFICEEPMRIRPKQETIPQASQPAEPAFRHNFEFHEMNAASPVR